MKKRLSILAVILVALTILGSSVSPPSRSQYFYIIFSSATATSDSWELERGNFFSAFFIEQGITDTAYVQASPDDGTTWYVLQEDGVQYTIQIDSSTNSVHPLKPIILYPFDKIGDNLVMRLILGDATAAADTLIGIQRTY